MWCPPKPLLPDPHSGHFCYSKVWPEDTDSAWWQNQANNVHLPQRFANPPSAAWLGLQPLLSDEKAWSRRRQRELARRAGQISPVHSASLGPIVHTWLDPNLLAVGCWSRHRTLSLRSNHLPVTEFNLSQEQRHAACEPVHVWNPGLSANLRGWICRKAADAFL